MNQPKEVSWTKLFALDAPAKDEGPKAKKCTCGNGNCKHAKRIRCVCGCGGIAHGIENRQGMEPLDKALGLGKPDLPRDLPLDLELSGRLEYP